MAIFKTDAVTDSGVVQSTGDGSATLAQSVALVQQQCEEIFGPVKAMRDQLSQLAVRSPNSAPS